MGKVVLRPEPFFLLKVVLSISMKKLPSLPSVLLQKNKEIALHCLDMLRAVGIYFAAMASVCKAESPFVLPRGPLRGILIPIFPLPDESDNLFPWLTPLKWY